MRRIDSSLDSGTVPDLYAILMPAALGSPLGTHRFQRAVMGEDLLEACNRLGAGCAGLQAIITRRNRGGSVGADSDQYAFPNDCALEATRTQGFSAGVSGANQTRKGIIQELWRHQSNACWLVRLSEPNRPRMS